MSAALLTAQNLRVALPDRARKPLFGRAPLTDILKGVDFSIARGETVGIVGESGSGKTTLGRTLVRLIQTTGGQLTFDGIDITHADETRMRPLRTRMQMIFQNSLSSLNPRRTVIDSIAMPALAAGQNGRARDMALVALERAGLSRRFAERYPHQLSGGQRQRVGIARAIVTNPDFILADEIVSGLDVSTQAQILTLMRELQRDMGLALAFIAHDLSVVRVLCSRVVVMLQGEIVEQGSCERIFSAAEHPYTRRLIDAIPLPEIDAGWLERVFDARDPAVLPSPAPPVMAPPPVITPPTPSPAPVPEFRLRQVRGRKTVGRYVEVQAGDGRSFNAYLAKPASGSGPGLVLLQDIFGVNDTIKQMADDYAEEGYVVMAPDLFWRLQPGVSIGNSAAERPRGLEFYAHFDLDAGIEDIEATMQALRRRPEHRGKVGVLGHAFGGTLAYLAAARTDVDCAVSYYGVGLADHLAEARRIRCPTTMHIAGADHHCPPEQQRLIADTFRSRPDVEVYNYPGADNAFATPGHDSWDRPAALMAGTRTLTQLKRVMGPYFSLAEIWEEHVTTEFGTKDVDSTMKTMVADPYVNHIPTMTGGVGHDQLKRFYKYHFIPSNPEDTKIIPISRTVGIDRIVDEMIFSFTHTREIDWMLPGLAPTGKFVEVPLVAVIHFRGDKLKSEHIYWDQASVLAQIGVVDAKGLPIAGRATAQKMINEHLPSNALMTNWPKSEELSLADGSPAGTGFGIVMPNTNSTPGGSPMLNDFAAAIASGKIRVIDLTQTLRASTPVIQLPPPFAQSSPFSASVISKYDERGPAWYWNNLAMGEHTGTHFDAPIHWVTGKDNKAGATDTIAVERFVAPACVIDCSKESAANEKFLLEPAHITAWEAKHGRIPKGAWVLMRTDWSKRTDPAKFLNAKEDGPHVPGPSAAAVTFLVTERDVNGFGVEAVGTDAGQAFAFEPAFPAHHLMHGHNKFGLASLTNLDLLPATGAVLITTPLKIENGSGSPLRVLALVEG